MVTALRKSLVEENMNLAKQQQQQQQQHNSFKPFEETKADNGTTSNSNGESVSSLPLLPLYL